MVSSQRRAAGAWAWSDLDPWQLDLCSPLRPAGLRLEYSTAQRRPGRSAG